MISRENIKYIFGLSPSQKGILFHTLLDNDSTYVEQMTVKISGSINSELLEKSFQKLVDRHDALRTIFVSDVGKEPLQIVLKEWQVHLITKSYLRCLEDEKATKLEQDRLEDRNNGFRISKEPLIRLSVFQTHQDQYILMLTCHHIILDGWSVSILFEELFEGYLAELEHRAPVFKQTESYQTYIKWLEKKDMEECRQFWSQYLNGYVDNSSLPKLQKKDNQAVTQKNIPLVLEKAIVDKIKTLSMKYKITINDCIQSVWAILLQQYSGCSDVLIPVISSGREGDVKNIERIIGLFINTVLVRVSYSEETTVLELIQKLHSDLQDCSSHGYLQLAELRNENVLGDFVLKHLSVYENYPSYGSQLERDRIGFTLGEVNSYSETTYDLSLVCVPNDETVTLNFYYNTNIYEAAMISQLTENYKGLLCSVLSNPDRLVKELDIVYGDNLEILKNYQNRKKEFDLGTTVYSLFLKTASENKSKIALKDQERAVTYEELEQMVNCISQGLYNTRVEGNMAVAVIDEASVEAVAAMLAIMKQGMIYVPIAPDDPQDRIQYILENSQVKIIFGRKTHNQTMEKEHAGRYVFFDMEEIENMQVTEMTESHMQIDELAYIMYTSGTTGNPKGVMIEHQSLLNQLFGLYELYDFNNMHHVLMSPLTFDPSIQQILLPLTTGGTLRLLKKEEKLDRKRFLEILKSDEIDILNAVPAMIKSIVSEGDLSWLHLKYLILAGEEFTTELYKKIRTKLSCEHVINIYGPTEATINATLYECQDEAENEKIAIGKPLLNYDAYILDSSKRLVPIGVVGELYLGGIGLARGYYNQPELTEKFFVSNPYDKTERLYKTGDLVRWRQDGNIEYIGRVDFQVKIRGMRVELDEIQNNLLKFDNIKDALVLAKKDVNNNKYLCAYYVSDKPYLEMDIKRKLREKLPEHMVPARFVWLEKFELTRNGKIDRKALPEVTASMETGETYVAPKNRKEIEMVQIWETVLGIKGIGVTDHFFELGGDSLKCIQLSAAIKKQKGVEVPIREIFANPTIDKLLQYISRVGTGEEEHIEKAKDSDFYEASAAQRRMYIIQTGANAGTGYNLPVFWKLEGELDVSRLEHTICELIKRHEILRTEFVMEDEKLVQKIKSEVEFHIDVVEDQDDFVAEKYVKEFDLQKAPLLRCTVIKSKKQGNIMLLDMHHIISDEASAGIFMKEFKCLYEGQTLEPLTLQYKDYSEWQNHTYQYSKNYSKQKEYWIQNLKETFEPLELPYDFERPKERTFLGNVDSIELAGNLETELRKLSKKTETTLFMILYSAFHVLLYQWSGQKNIVVGTPIMGRPHAELENVLGMFVNTVLLRTPLDGKESYLDFLQNVKNCCLNAYENQEYQLDDLLELQGTQYDRSRNPLFDVMFVMQNLEEQDLSIGKTKLIPYGTDRKNSKLDLTMLISESITGLKVEIEYNVALFREETIKRFLDGYQKILQQICGKEDLLISEIDAVSDTEKKFYQNINSTQVSIPKKTIVELIEEQVSRTPDRVAVAKNEKSLTYQELNYRANQLARWLLAEGIKENEIIGIMMERSCEMLITILAILKAGACYVPIEPDCPLMRKQYMIQDCSIRYILTEKNIPDVLEMGGRALCFSDIPLKGFDHENLNKKPSMEHLAYIIYTSGTSGQPKGVMIEHHSLVNYIVWAAKNYLNHPDANMPFYSMVSFDLTVTTIFAPLITGNHLIVYDNSLGNYAIREIIKDNRVEVMKLTPAHLRLLKEIELPQNCRLRTLIVGGENLETSLAEQITHKFGGNIDIYNEYGPTEATVGCMIYRYRLGDKGSSVSIGIPADNTEIYVLGKNRQLLPVNVVGDMYIGGEGVARGYNNKEKLTEERFVNHPFHEGKRLYMTGDMGRWKEDGTLEFLGREDHQVKVKGFRIELEEIQSVLLEMPEIREAVVVDRRDAVGNIYLCAYLIQEREISTSVIRERLCKKLPKYMIPDSFGFVASYPLTSNGKLDKKALPVLEREKQNGYEAPKNQLQEELVELWKEILKVDEVGIKDDFFELGGDSLASIRMVGAISKKYQADISVRDIFENSDIERLSVHLQRSKKSLYQKIKRLEDKKVYPASSPQKRMYTVQLAGHAGISYNVPVFVELVGTYSKDKLEAAIRTLIQRHEILRTSFAIAGENSEIVQCIHESAEFVLEEETAKADWSPLDYIREFDLNQVPLLRAVLLHLPEERTILMLDMHHIISDGMSAGIFLEEMLSCYEGIELPDLLYQYKDYSEWQREVFCKSDAYFTQEQYWLNQLRELSPMNLCEPKQRAGKKNYTGDIYSFDMDNEAYKKLKQLSLKTGSTSFMILLSVFDLTLARLAGMTDIAIGTPMMGRPHPDLTRILGIFVNSVILRNRVEDTDDYLTFLKQVKETAMEAYDNQEYPFEELVKNIGCKTEQGRNPLFDVMFVMQPKPSIQRKIEELHIVPLSVNLKISKLDLTLMAFEGTDHVDFQIEYSTELFDEGYIKEFADTYSKFLYKVLNTPEIKIEDLQIIDSGEQKKMSADIRNFQEQLNSSAEFRF